MVAIEKLQHEGTLEKYEDFFKRRTRSDSFIQSDLKDETKEPTPRTEISTQNDERWSASKLQVLFLKLQKLRLTQTEQAVWLKLPSVGSDDQIGIAERDSAVTTLKSMQRFYNYGCDTLAGAVHYLDRFLTKVKVKRRYLSCVTAASFLLSTKMNEEEEVHPSVSDLSSLNRHAWQPSDLKRMEKIILEKLGWNLFPAATCLSFLQLIYRMLQFLNTEINKQFFKKLVDRSELYMNYTRCASYNACTLAMAVTQQCLKEEDLNNNINKYVLLHIQAVCQITDSELFDCHCALAKQLQQCNHQPTSHPKCLPLPKIVPRPSLVKRPSFYGTTDLPTIEEGSWDSESSEEEEILVESYVPCQIVNFLPFSVNPATKMSQSYCLLVDQCSLPYCCNQMCNTPLA